MQNIAPFPRKGSTGKRSPNFHREQPGLWEIQKGSNEEKLPLSYEDTSVFAWCQPERHPVINSIVKKEKNVFLKNSVDFMNI